MQVPCLVEYIKTLSRLVAEDPNNKPALRKAVHTLTELAKTGAAALADPAPAALLHEAQPSELTGLC